MFFLLSFIGLVRKQVRKTSNFYSYCIEFLKIVAIVFFWNIVGTVETKNSYGDPPQISVDIPRMKDVHPESKSWWNVELLRDVLLLTVTDEEFLSFFAFLHDVSKCYIKELGHVYFGEIGDGPRKVTISLVKSFRGSTQGSAALNVVRTAVDVFKPKVAFSVGCCAGLRREQTQLGDVVISGKLLTCGDKQIVGDKPQWGGRKLDVSRNMGCLVKSAADGWQPPLEDPESCDVKVHCNAEILSGLELVNSPKECEELLHQFPEAIAIEPEGQGQCYYTVYLSGILLSVRSSNYFCIR